MPKPKIEILGAYSIEFTDKQIRQFIEDSFGDVLDEDEKIEMFTLKRQELSSVMAFDVLVTNADKSFDAGDFAQHHSDQVAWDEIYLSPDGLFVNTNSKFVGSANFRMYFFLHYVDPNKPLLSSYGELIIPEPKPLPDYLRSLHPFKPVD